MMSCSRRLLGNSHQPLILLRTAWSSSSSLSCVSLRSARTHKVLASASRCAAITARSSCSSTVFPSSLQVLPAFEALASSDTSFDQDFKYQRQFVGGAAAAVVAAVAACALIPTTTKTTLCDTAVESDSSDTKKKKKKSSKKRKSKKDREEKQQHRKYSLTPSNVAGEDFEKLQEETHIEQMPEYSMDQVSYYNGEDGKPIWMTYGGYVYDVTDFIVNHPGGEEKIRLAAGSAIEPFWHLYRQHFATDLPMRLMEHMVIGTLKDKDQEEVDLAMEQLSGPETEDPYAHEPLRHKSLIVHSDAPMNAEVPSHLLTNSYLTPTSLFYIRHHHPVPLLDEHDTELEHTYHLELDLTECGLGKRKISLHELKKLPKTTITATLQCSGNRRSGMNEYERTSGTPWGQGAISTAQFSGVRFTDLLKLVGGVDDVMTLPKLGMKHVVATGLDDMSASIGIEKGLNPFGDVVLCWEMNGEPLPREHGFPLRLVVPGYSAVRSVKWVQRIQISAEEAYGPWQRGLNYKTLPPSVTNASMVNIEEMPSMMQASLYSGITKIEKVTPTKVEPSQNVHVKASGWAWAGGGHNVVRVDVTPDDGKTWYTAKLLEGKNQPFGRAWAWVFWECDIPQAPVREDGTVKLASKAVDFAFNSQPDQVRALWNVRGLGNNTWYRAEANVVQDQDESRMRL